MGVCEMQALRAIERCLYVILGENCGLQNHIHCASNFMCVHTSPCMQIIVSVVKKKGDGFDFFTTFCIFSLIYNKPGLL